MRNNINIIFEVIFTIIGLIMLTQYWPVGVVILIAVVISNVSRNRAKQHKELLEALKDKEGK